MHSHAWRMLGSLSTRSNAEAAGLRRAGRSTAGAHGRSAVALLIGWRRRLAIYLLIFGRRCLQNLRWFDVLSGPLPLAFLGSLGPPRPGGWAEISPSVVFKSRALCQKTSEWAGAAVAASRRQPAKTLRRAARKCGGKLRGGRRRHRSPPPPQEEQETRNGRKPSDETRTTKARTGF